MSTERLILTFVLIWCCNSNCQDYFFLAKNLNLEYRCVTNSSYALSWIDEDTNQTLERVSHYVPETQQNNFNCKIGNDTNTKKYFVKSPWSLKNSSSDSFNELILDRRWEDMKVVLTDYDTFYTEPLHFRQILSTLKYDFRVPFSVRGEKEAHIFLCDGPHPPEANCYWFMLHAFNGTESAIRKCEKKFIPSLNSYYAEEPCRTKLKTIQHPDFPPYLSRKYWSHFQITKKANDLSLVKIDNTKKSILELSDKKHVINVTHLTIYSRHTNVLWKFHSLEYIYTNKETNEVTLGPPIHSLRGVVCISMFISMCASCKLKVSLTAEKLIITEKDYVTPKSGWFEIRFLVENLDDNKFNLLVSTIGVSSDRFWAIDDVRQCQKNEIRVITLNKRATCQLLSGENNVISSKKSLETIENNCPEDTIGELCVPCKWIFGECEKIKICSKSSTTKNRCFCSAGFNYDECFYVCKPGSYGHGCQQKCGRCVKSCNNVNGTCPVCTAHYSGPKCDIPPATVFAKAPLIVSVNYTTVKIDISNFDIKNVTNDDKPSAYIIQFKEVTDYGQNWTNWNSNYQLYKNQTSEITNLKADTTYSVRCVVITKKGNVYADPRIPYSTFTTKCQEISENDIIVKPSNTTVNITLAQINKFKCKISKYVVKISNDSHLRAPQIDYVFFDKLSPFTNYTITLERDSKRYEKSFRTLEGLPEKVQNLSISNISSSSGVLQWQKPVSVNGIFQYYIVEYQYKTSRACDSPSNNSSVKDIIKVQNTSIAINNLIPFSIYSVTLYTVNTKFRGRPETIFVATTISDKIHENELPTIVEIVIGVRSVTVKLSQIHCTRMRGPLLVEASATCMSRWCANYNLTNTFLLLPNTTLLLDPLKPFTDYNLLLKFCRNNTICSGEVKTTQFKTKSTLPNVIQDLLVFSKNETSISLRWKPPYPPTGVIYNYKIRISCYSNLLQRKYEYLITVGRTPCKIWPDYHCATLKDLKQDKEYTATIYVRNQEPQGYGKGLSIVATTKSEPSEAPYDLNVTWTVNNDLQLSWKHPNRSNGQIQYFKINIGTPITVGISIEKNFSAIEKANFTYHYTVEMRNFLLPATHYTIKIAAYNGHSGKEAIKSDTSPPDTPSINQQPQFSSTDNTIVMNVSIKRPREAEKCIYELVLLISNYLKVFDLDNFRMISKCNITKFDEKISAIIGNNRQSDNCEQTIKNPPLDSGGFYNITVLLKGTFANKTKHKMYSFSHYTTGLSKPQKYYLSGSLGSLFIIILTTYLLIFYLKRYKLAKMMETQEMLQNQIPSVTFTKGKVETETAEISSMIFSKAIQIAKFELYIKESEQNKEIERQHRTILNNPTRTIYETTDGSQYFDYIDMEYVNGFNIAKAYIATETPKTKDEFWKTVWEENVKHIVLFGEIKTDRYWPEENEKMQWHHLTVELVFSKVLPTYEYRKFILIQNEEIKHVEQIHNTYSGPNPEKLVPLFRKMVRFPLNSASPIFVHSSVGISRTGFVLLCDMCLRMAEKENVVDVFRNLHRLSNYKIELVDNLETYRLAHLVISACLFGNTSEGNSGNIYVNF